MNIIRKAKNNYLYDIKDNKYLNLSSNNNIIGHSNKRLTTTVKNNISSSWDITADSIYHKRLRQLMKKRFTDDYILMTSNSLPELFLLLQNTYKESTINIIGERLKRYLTNKNISFSSTNNNKGEKINIFDMAEYYLYNKDIVCDTDNFNVLNFYFYPESELKTFNASVVILPQFYSGNFNYINVLVNKTLSDYCLFTNPLEDISSLYISSSLKNISIIENMEISNTIKLPVIINSNFIQRGRLFSYKDIDNFKEHPDILDTKDIVINHLPPYYNYFPLTIEDYQIKKIERLFNDY